MVREVIPWPVRTHRKARTILCLGINIRDDPVDESTCSQHWEFEHGKSSLPHSSATWLPFPHPSPSMPKAGCKVDPELIAVGQLPLCQTTCNTWQSRTYPLPGQHNRASHDICWYRCGWARHEVVRMGDLSPLLICFGAAWVMEIYPLSGPSVLDAGGRPGPVVIRAGELSLTYTICKTQETRSCTSPEKHNRANPVFQVMCEAALNLWAWENCTYLY